MEPRAGTSTQDAVGPYLRAVRRRWRFVTLVTLLTAAIATITALRAGSTYATSASVLVTPLPQADPTFVGTGAVVDSGDPARTVQTAAALINSPEAAGVTASALGDGWTAQRVQRAVSVTPLGQSDVLSVTAQGSNPKQAVELANDFTTAAVAARARIVQRNIANELAALEARGAVLPSRGNAAQLSDLAGRIGELRAAQASGGDPTLAVSQRAQPPDAPTGAPHWLVLLLSLFGGFALGSIGALVLEFFSRPVRDVDELTSLFPVPVLGSIPTVKHRGSRALSPWLFPPRAFEPVRMVRVQLELSCTVPTPVIMVTSAGAADGKTTVVGALAAAFSESGQKVIVIDLDLRKPSLARTLGVEIPSEVTTRNGECEPPLGDLISVPRLDNVSLLTLPVANMSSIDEIMLRLPLLVAQARHLAGCVILDTAPVGEVSEALRIAPMCDTVLFVARPRHTDRRRLILAHDLLTRAGVRTAGIVVVGKSMANNYGAYYGDGYREANRSDGREERMSFPDRVMSSQPGRRVQ
jgi:Mrp family chromosome partitioning ATPase